MNKVGCQKGYKQSPEHIAKRVALISGKKRSSESIERYKISNKGRNLGRKRPEWLKEKYSIMFRGENNPNWQGGKKQEHKKERGRIEYRRWKEAVYARDGNKCVLCGDVEGPFHVDHIKPFAYYPTLRFEVGNGRILCIPCHQNTDTYFRKGLRRKELVK